MRTSIGRHAWARLTSDLTSASTGTPRAIRPSAAKRLADRYGVALSVVRRAAAVASIEIAPIKMTRRGDAQAADRPPRVWPKPGSRTAMIAGLIGSGSSLTLIASIAGVTKQRVSQIAKRAGLSPRELRK